ncbi:alpha/beta hydrolase [Pleurocapsales cyanobacterium LEGE 06147]|nr:alpha/beta hydrolase [Pleurocapsales cyanobacterium LEGE 06147]
MSANWQNSIRTQRLTSRSWLCSLALGIISAILTAIPVKAAETIYFKYGPFLFSLPVDSLETFAKEGTIDQELAFYLGQVSEEEQAQFREALLQRADVNPVQIYRFFNTLMGEALLIRFGNLIQLQGGLNGFYGLRGALILAAADPEGLSVLNFIRKFPTNIQLNTELIIQTARRFDLLIEATNIVVAEMAKLSAAEAATEPPIDFAALPDIRIPGPFGFEKETLTLVDESREFPAGTGQKRQLRVILYQPQQWRPGKAPVVVGSHGLASNPEHFKERAQHLASYGYVVALIDHPGSNYQQFQDMLAGYSSDFFAIDEFIDRPLDVSYVLDELERRNQSQFQGRLNLKEVGVMGHSLGGYTALALAGAEINFEKLEHDCQPTLETPNLSLILQCLALELPRKEYNLQDDRVEAVLAINPVASSIFGPQGLSQIRVPVILVAGSLDLATPAVYEQVRVFSWMKNSDRYLALVEGQAHVNFSQLDAGTRELIESLPNLQFTPPELLGKYGNSGVLAFFEVYLADNPEYRPYLQSSYIRYISKDPFNLYLIDSSSADELERVIRNFRAREGLPEIY